MSKYQTHRSPNASIATSIGEETSRLTSHTARSWGTQRKIPKEIDFTDATAFPPIQKTQSKPESENQHLAKPTAHDESITDTTVIQQAIDSALKKAYEEHRKEVAEMQERFNQQLAILQQSQNTATLETKFDQLMAMLIANNQVILERESPIRKKGRPSDAEQTIMYNSETPPRSNQTHISSQEDDYMAVDDHDEPIIGPVFETPTKASPPSEINTICDQPADTNPHDGQWITKTKKDKKAVTKLTQTKILDMMTNGGYGQTHGSPPRNDQSRSQYQEYKANPPRTVRNTPPRQSQTKSSDKASTVHLVTLSSSRSGEKEPRGREH